MLDDISLIKRFTQDLNDANTQLITQYQKTGEAFEFYSGDLMNYRDTVTYADTSGRKRNQLVCFNKVKPYVNAVKGFMAQNRRKAKYSARLLNDDRQEEFSTYCNALAGYVRDDANADQVETQQDGDMLIGGYGAIDTAMTYGIGQATTDPNGQVIVGRLNPLVVFWDPKARDTNLLDAGFCGYKKTYKLEDAMDLFDDKWADHFDDASKDSENGDDGYRYYQRGGRYNKVREDSVDWNDKKKDMVNVYFYQWFEYETFYRAENPLKKLQNPQAVALVMMKLQELAADADGDIFSLDPQAEILTFDQETKGKLVAALGEYIEPFAYKRKVYYTAILSKSHVFTKYKSLSQQGFTIKFKTGDWDDKNKIWVGMVQSMKDPVLYYNKALTEMMRIIASNSNGGVMIEENAVDDIRQFEQQYARTDSVVVVKEGAVQKGQIRAKKEPYTPSGYEAIIQAADASISDVNGIDRAFLGSSENKQETGILQRRRIKQVTSSLACYFDAITLYQKEHARLLLDFMRVFVENNSGGMFRILGENGKERYLEITSDKMCSNYDVDIIESPQSDEDKMEFAQLLTSIGDKLLTVDPASGKIMYALSLQYIGLEQDDKQKALQVLMPQQQPVDPAYVKQLEDQIRALNDATNRALLENTMSQTELNKARVNEVAAATHQKIAAASKTEQEAIKTHVETAFMENNPEKTTANI